MTVKTIELPKKLMSPSVACTRIQIIGNVLKAGEQTRSAETHIEAHHHYESYYRTSAAYAFISTANIQTLE